MQIILQEENTNFDSLIKNLEKNSKLYQLVYDIIMEGKEISFNTYNQTMKFGIIYGIFTKSNHNKLKVHNRIYEQLIYNYMTSVTETSISTDNYNFQKNFINKDQSLNFEKILIKFSEFMKLQYSKNDSAFLEKDGRLVFLAFLKPIINGNGFDYKEVQISEEKRLDIVITYLSYQYIVELKVWRGEKYHKNGLSQLADYLSKKNLEKGYLIVFNTNPKNKKKWKCETILQQNKKIFVTWI